MLKTMTTQPSKPVCQDLALNTVELLRIRSGSSKIGQQMMLLYNIVFFEQMDRTTSAVHSSGLLCEHATVNLILHNFAIRKM